MWEVSWNGGKDDVRGWLGQLGDLSAPLSSMLLLFSGSQEASPFQSGSQQKTDGSRTIGNEGLLRRQWDKT